jgi:arylsulfatase A-like enzyme
MAEKQPNVLLILTDQQRADAVGFRGKNPCRTPNIDRLAAEGISFDRALTPSPLCTPARAGIFTGLYPHQVNAMKNGSRLEARPIFPNVLKRRGYQLDYVGKWHLDFAGEVVSAWFDRTVATQPAHKDFEKWCREHNLMEAMILNDRELRSPRPPHMTIPRPKVMRLESSKTYEAWLTDRAVEYLETRPKDRPFILVCSYQGPHPPFKVPEPYYSMYDPTDIIEPPNFKPLPNKPRSNITSYFHQLWMDYGEDWEVWKKSVAVYWGFVTMIDFQIGRLLRAVEDTGLLDDTLIVFASDHGELLGQHGLWQKMMPYEEALRVPLVMRYPSLIRGGLRCQSVASLIDIVPTVLSVLGEEAPEEMEGQELSSAFRDGVVSEGDGYRFSEHKPLGEWHQTVDWRLITDDRYKYVWNRGDLDELYDLGTDPYELRNGIEDQALRKIVERLRERLLRWMTDTTDPLAPLAKSDIATKRSPVR